MRRPLGRELAPLQGANPHHTVGSSLAWLVTAKPCRASDLPACGKAPQPRRGVPGMCRGRTALSPSSRMSTPRQRPAARRGLRSSVTNLVPTRYTRRRTHRTHQCGSPDGAKRGPVCCNLQATPGTRRLPAGHVAGGRLACQREEEEGETEVEFQCGDHEDCGKEGGVAGRVCLVLHRHTVSSGPRCGKGGERVAWNLLLHAARWAAPPCWLLCT